MAGGRGAPGRGRDEPPESYPQRQDHELQALEAIYGADFQDLRPDSARTGRNLACLVGAGVLRPSLPWRPYPSWAAGLPEANTRHPLRILDPFHPLRSTRAHFLSLHPQPARPGLQNPCLGQVLLQRFS